MKILKNKLQRSFLGLLFLLVIGLHTTKGQGVKFLSEAEYQNLPDVNWAILTANAATNTIAVNSNGVVMLKTPPPKDQGSQGSCVGWSLGYAGMSILLGKEFDYDWSQAARSPSYIYNQIKGNPNNCKDGCYYVDAFRLLKNQGICSYSSMPYNESDCMTQPNNEQKNEAIFNTLLLWGTLKNLTSVSDIKRALKLGHPVIASCYLYTSFDNMWNTNGIWKNFNKNESHRGGHSTCIIGYDDTKQMFKVLNSWGTDGGDNGFYWITYDLIRRGCLKEAYIMSGITTPFNVKGKDIICNQETYVLEHAPDGVNVQWSTSNNNLELIAGQGTKVVTFRKKGNGKCNIKAQIIGHSKVYNKIVIVGIPTTSKINVYSNRQLFEKLPQDFLLAFFNFDFVSCYQDETPTLYAYVPNIFGANSIFDASISNSAATQPLGYEWRIKSGSKYWSIDPIELDNNASFSLAPNSFIFITCNSIHSIPQLPPPPVIEVRLHSLCGISKWKEISGFSIKNCDDYGAYHVLTPNGDGVNDTFEIKIAAKTTTKITIFNDKKDIVYQKNNYMKDKERFKGAGNMGKSRGSNLPEGVYTYTLEGGSKHSGHIYIQRKQ